ncbi:MAG: Rrf2 family transcriptional regulator [Spirochaetales bacterium]|nr:Rrf2 family transcriptional regulator [Spirochaetales bacterium]
MFSLSAKSTYGVSAVLELAYRYGGGAVQIREIASSQEIPHHYLEQILVALKRGGFVQSFRGAQGGYALARPPADIQLYEVLTLLEGPLNVAPEGRGDERLCGLWSALTSDIRQRLDRSFAEIIEEIRRNQEHFNFSI